MNLREQMAEIEHFDPSLQRKPRNIFELIAWILVYKDTIIVHQPDGKNVSLGELPNTMAAEWVQRFVERFADGLPGGDLWIPHRVMTADEAREQMQHASWQIQAIRDWAKVATIAKSLGLDP